MCIRDSSCTVFPASTTVESGDTITRAIAGGALCPGPDDSPPEQAATANAATTAKRSSRDMFHLPICGTGRWAGSHRRRDRWKPVSYTHLRAHETPEHLVCRLLLEK